jgi:nitrate reductase molybdenum cofactor assembly chaperone NarJ/NarW
MVDRTLWDSLAALIAYPKAMPTERLTACIDACAVDPDLAGALDRFRSVIAGMSLTSLQECYSEVFDFGPDCTLDVGWHLFGESRERGMFLASLVDDLEKAGVMRSMELPDHLTHVLMLIGRARTGQAAALARLVEPAVEKIQRALHDRRSEYAALLEAIHMALGTVAERGAPARR